MESAEKYIKDRLADRIASGNYRTLKPESDLIDFCSNDYLGFSRSAILKSKIDEEVNSNPIILNGSTGSRLISGNLIYTEDLEQEIACLFKSESGLLFNSGYDANVGLLSSLPQRGDTIITDELIHASVIDGARLSHANRYTFKHNDAESLEAKLKNAKGICYVVIESVYSMDGDIPPIVDLLEVTEKYGAYLIIDEAHAVGLYKTGVITNLNLADRVFARIVTFGKALGCHGAIVLGSDLLRGYLINFARSFIYTTACTFHQLASIKMACRLLQQSDTEIGLLKTNIGLFKQSLNTSTNYPLIDSTSSIQCILLKNNKTTKQIAEALQNKGLNVRPILSPTVAQGSERIRICLHSFNRAEDISLLTQTINNLIYAE